MRIEGGSELEKMSVEQTLGDEIGIYFYDVEGRKILAFAYNSAKKAISSVKKLKKVLHVQYNIEKEVQAIAETEKEEEVNITTDEGKKKMANVKRSVNVKQLCREGIDNGQTADEVRAAIAQVYLNEGKDEKYAQGRARSVYSSICKEKGMAAPPRKKREKRADNAAETAPETPADTAEAAEGTEVPAPEEPGVAEGTDTPAEATGIPEVAQEAVESEVAAKVAEAAEEEVEAEEVEAEAEVVE